MNVETLRVFALQLEEATEGFPFGEDVLVFKVNNKIFMLLPLNEQPVRFNLKCDPEKAIELREHYPNSVLPGYHMNKKHWNTIVINGELKSSLLKEMITDSYELVKGKPGRKK